MTGMASAALIAKHVLEIWTPMKDKRSRVRIGRVKFRLGQHVRISKEKIKFAKGSEHNYTEEIFRISKVIRRTSRPVYELVDLNAQFIEVQFYGEELTALRVTKRTTYKIHKMPDKRFRNGNLQYVVRWKEYRKVFDSWFLVVSVKNI